VNEEGQRITVALDDNTSSSGGVFTRTSNAISVPEFISRSIDTTVWVRNGQALILGGLYRNTKQKNLASLPWLTQGENMINNVVSQISPMNNTPRIPLIGPFGNRSENESRRELVFIVKADVWRKAFTVTEGFGLESEEVAEGEGESEGEDDVIKPKENTNFLGDFIDSLTNTDEGMGVGGSLGGRDQ
jgi:type II secretory pathway component GspD/PulD (secretin)